jgi:type II secretory pathway pseudopilin PulG
MRKSKGFTLIELLVVIAIIGILSTIVLVSLNSARQKARDTRRLGDVRQVALALEMYYDDNSSYPSVTGCTAANWTGTLATAITGGGYMTSLPIDPLNSGNNVYMFGCDGTDYVLRGYLENASNSALDTDVDGTAVTCACADPAYCIQP